MAQRNQIRGNIIVPITDHFGFGLPGAAGDLDSATGPRVFATSGTPAGTVSPMGSMALDYTDGSLWMARDAAGLWWTNVTSGATALKDTAMFQEGGYNPKPTSAVQDAWGSCGDWTELAPGAGPSYADGGADGYFILYDTAGVAAQEATAWSLDNTVNALGLPYYLTRFALMTDTDVRFFIGITDSMTTMVSADDPAADYVGVQFSTAGANANYMFVYNQGGGAQVIVDSGYTPTAGEVLFLEIDYITATTVTVRLRDSAFAIVASQTWTGAAPVGLVIGGVGAGVEDISGGGAVKSFKLGEGHVYQKTAAGS